MRFSPNTKSIYSNRVSALATAVVVFASSCGTESLKTRRGNEKKPGAVSGAEATPSGSSTIPGKIDGQNQNNPSTTIPAQSGLPAIPVPSTSSIASSGSGGATGDSEANFTASNGKSTSYKISVPTDAKQKLYGLNIYLHGDGGGDYSWFFKSNAKIAQARGLIGVTILAPNVGRQWYKNGEENALLVHELIQNELFKKFNVDKSKVYFAGTSGGSQFLTGQFIPTYGLNYNSGAVLMCGGPANWQRDFKTSDEFLKKFKFAWISTKFDFLLPQVEKGITYYSSKGFQVDSEILPSGDHCKFPGGLEGALEKMISKVLP